MTYSLYRKSRYGVAGYRRILDGTESTAPTQPFRRGVTIRIYDTADVLQAIVSSNCGHSNFLGGRFEINDTGPGSFELNFSREPAAGIWIDWRFDVHLYGDSQPWYSGFLQTLPGSGSAERGYKYKGFGFYAKTDHIFVPQLEMPAGTPIHSIVDILARFLESESDRRIIYAAGLITPVPYSTIGEMKFRFIGFRDCMRQLVALAGGSSGSGWEWGIDEQRRFYFRPISTRISDESRFWANRHLQTYIPEVDASKLYNVIYVKLAKIRTDVSPTSWLYKTNFIETPLIDSPSRNTYGIRVKVYNAPSVYDTSDSIRAASAELLRSKDPIQRARISGVQISSNRITTNGYCRITGPGGNYLDLPKKKIVYSLGPDKIGIDLQLGEHDPVPGQLLADLSRAQAEDELSRQTSQNQF